MEKILAGLRNFREHEFPTRRALFERLSTGQSPEALLITCSDSRIAPSLLTGTEPGELFVLRNAGNVVPVEGAAGGELATIEYAVKVLRVPDVVVCGHSGCGAVGAALQPRSAEGMPAVQAWLAHLEVEPAGSEGEARARLDEEIVANVRRQLRNLSSLACVREATEAGELRVHGWIYDIGSGVILALDGVDGPLVPVLGPPELVAQEESSLVGHERS